MQCLRMRYHAAAVYLGDDSLSGKTLVEGKVAVKSKAGDYSYAPFAGFTHSLSKGAPVKLVNIEAYTEEPFEKPWLEFGRHTCLLGVAVPGEGVFCYLDNQYPVAWCDINTVK